MMRRYGFGLVEILVAAAVLIYALFAFLTIYSSTASSEVQSQNRTLASLLAQSALEEWQDHVYGSVPPESWGFPDGSALESAWMRTTPAELYVEGRSVNTDFNLKRYCSTGTSIGRGGGQGYDVATVVLSWAEGTSAPTTQNFGEFTRVFCQNDNKHIVVQVPLCP